MAAKLSMASAAAKAQHEPDNMYDMNKIRFEQHYKKVFPHHKNLDF
jgi:hypothetical protein